MDPEIKKYVGKKKSMLLQHRGPWNTIKMWLLVFG